MASIKQVPSFFVFIIVLLFGASFAARAQTTLIPSDVTWNGSGEIEVPLKVTNSVKITGLQFTLKWDPSVLDIVMIPGWREDIAPTVKIDDSQQKQVGLDDYEDLFVASNFNYPVTPPGETDAL